MINWTKIQVEYVAGNMSLKQLAKDKRVSYSTLSKKASEGGWAQKRKEHRAKIGNEALARARARGLKRMDELLKATEAVLDTALQTVQDPEQFKRWIVTEGQGEGLSESSEKKFEKVDTKAMKDMVTVLKDLTGLMRDAYDLKTPAQELGEKLARERIGAVKAQAAQTRAQTEKLKRESGTDDSGTGGAVILPAQDLIEDEPE